MRLKIGELAKMMRVNIQTIRYYERRGLLTPIERMESGYRIYDEDARRRLEFIRYSKKLGFSLKETEELLRLKVSSTARCGDIKKKAEEKLLEIDKKIEVLQSIHHVLKDLIKACRSRQTTEECPILHAIDRKEDR
jgi:MerR family mercuric resistance operon transcriptional regulator/MerR family gold-responsive transcriptional activator of gol and ges genes